MKKPKSLSDFKKYFFPKNPSLNDLKEKLEFYVRTEQYEKATFVKQWIDDYKDLGIEE